MKPLVPAVAAEFIGTFALCFFGIGAVFSTGGNMLGVALAHGLVLCVLVAGCMYISGAQFNPAVSIGLVVAGKQTLSLAGVFAAVQIVAAVVATWLVCSLVGWETPLVKGAAHGATRGDFTELPSMAWRVIGLEAVCTGTLMLVILASVVDDRAHKIAGLPIGLTVMLCILAAGRFTGASLNPARTLGPAICGKHWEMWYAYMIGPIIGACIAAAVYRLFWANRWER